MSGAEEPFWKRNYLEARLGFELTNDVVNFKLRRVGGTGRRAGPDFPQ